MAIISFSDRAWMINKNNNIVSVKYHPLGAPDEDAISDGIWLLNNDPSCNRNMIYTYLVNYIIEDLGHPADVIDELSIEGLHDIFYIEDNMDRYIDDNVDLDRLATKIKKHLNNEWLRVRYGGEYNSRLGSRELYFRISSNSHYDWYNTIMSFILNIDRSVSNVTVETDINTTGRKVLYWNHMPIEEILDSKGVLVMETFININMKE